MQIPIIRIELESMRHQLNHAIMAEMDGWKDAVREAVRSACTEENIRAILARHAREAIDQAIKAEVSNYFLYGKGRSAITEAVARRLASPAKD